MWISRTVAGKGAGEASMSRARRFTTIQAPPSARRKNNSGGRSISATGFSSTVVRLAVSFLWLDFAYYASFFGALRRVGQVMAVRKSVTVNLQLSDREI